MHFFTKIKNIKIMFKIYEMDGKQVRHEYVFGTRHYLQPEIPRPEKSMPYFDQIFGTKITRISDYDIDKLRRLSSKGYGSLMHPAYPKHNYDNADGSLLLFNGFLVK